MNICAFVEVIQIKWNVFSCRTQEGPAYTWLFNFHTFARTFARLLVRLWDQILGPTHSLRDKGAKGQHRNLGTWELGNLGTWELGNLGTWELGSLGTWKLGSLGILELGNFGTWELGNLPHIFFTMPNNFPFLLIFFLFSFFSFSSRFIPKSSKFLQSIGINIFSFFWF